MSNVSCAEKEIRKSVLIIRELEAADKTGPEIAKYLKEQGIAEEVACAAFDREGFIATFSKDFLGCPGIYVSDNSVFAPGAEKLNFRGLLFMKEIFFVPWTEVSRCWESCPRLTC